MALITRAETATIFFRLLKDDVRDDNLRTSNTFADVPNDYWANTAISTMAGLGIVQGRSSTAFDPNASHHPRSVRRHLRPVRYRQEQRHPDVL